MNTIRILKAFLLTSALMLAALSSAQSNAKQTVVLNKNLNVTIDYFLSVSFGDGATAMTLTIADGGQAGTYDSSAPQYTIQTNANTSVTPSFTNSTPTPAPGTWTALVSSNGTTFVSSYSVTPGTATGNVKARVTGLSLANATPGSYATTVTVTFTQP
jgi:hypothetical protein